MTPEDVVRQTKQVVTTIGAAFGDDPGYRARGTKLGLSRWPFYFGGRAGVLGEVEAGVVAAACGFFAPDLVGEAWAAARATVPLGEIVAADVEECIRWGRTAYGDLDDLDRLAGLLERVVAAADPSGRPLFAAWRAFPAAHDGDPAARTALALLRLREHRGSSHLIAVLASGLTPLRAILTGRDARKAEANGWHGPWPEPRQADEAALAQAHRLTDELAAAPYATLTENERTDLATMLRHIGRRGT
ncbi:hypothetical protein [Nonomuraea sp. NPDC050643]|uniref:SCO6745 family protein n=1 Tax=Nonomuraea sp. NPDC050643 TaxID=3155660 RepID=UPI00340ABD24